MAILKDVADAINRGENEYRTKVLGQKAIGEPSHATLQPIPVVRQDRDWSVSVEDDGVWGYFWFATRLGVLWAKGWHRTRDPKQAELAAKAAGSMAYRAHILSGGES